MKTDNGGKMIMKTFEDAQGVLKDRVEKHNQVVQEITRLEGMRDQLRVEIGYAQGYAEALKPVEPINKEAKDGEKNKD